MLIPYEVDCSSYVEIDDERIKDCRSENELSRLIYALAKEDAENNMAIRIDRSEMNPAFEILKEALAAEKAEED